MEPESRTNYFSSSLHFPPRPCPSPPALAALSLPLLFSPSISPLFFRPLSLLSRLCHSIYLCCSPPLPFAPPSLSDHTRPYISPLISSKPQQLPGFIRSHRVVVERLFALLSAPHPIMRPHGPPHGRIDLRVAPSLGARQSPLARARLVRARAGLSDRDARVDQDTCHTGS